MPLAAELYTLHHRSILSETSLTFSDVHEPKFHPLSFNSCCQARAKLFITITFITTNPQFSKPFLLNHPVTLASILTTPIPKNPIFLLLLQNSHFQFQFPPSQFVIFSSNHKTQKFPPNFIKNPNFKFSRIQFNSAHPQPDLTIQPHPIS
ncbi:hypothetical protein RJT34_20356 [Clitoria ternatea]|uniref:Uncharacterized protein n=1 Tax=Clitoria ternatea TaxID=43366 RepID=A0AAN9ISP4_CLITE